jgi:transcriptional regulator with XRE-family HTH domain
VITIRNAQHLARVLAYLRQNAGLTRRELGSRLFVTATTIGNRDRGRYRWDTDSTIDAANVVGYDLALIPQRRPGRRPTGTGWPA